MKTIKKADEIKRVEDKNADEMVKNGWSFCPKKEWKTKIRGNIKVKKNKETKDEEVKPKTKRTYKSKNKDIDTF